jgi:DNA-binding NtrC family response regulator
VNGAKHILVVDDEAKVLLVLSTALQMLGEQLEVVTARGAREALEKIDGDDFDLIITDVKMPDIDGIQLTELVRSVDPRAAVVWITAYGCHKIRAASRRLGVFRCLDKPIRVGQLRQVALEALQSGNSG